MSDKTILLVEDNPDDAMLTKHALAKTIWKNMLVIAGDGVEAQEYLQGNKSGGMNARPQPSLILLDLKMPRVNGLELLRKIRENAQTRFVPVVILTSSNEQQDIIDSYTLGANCYIRKPIDFEQFETIIRKIIDFWLNLNEVPGMPAE